MLNSIPNIISPEDRDKLLGWTAAIISAYVGENAIPRAEIPQLIKDVHCTLGDLGWPLATVSKLAPAINPNRTITDDYIVCLEDGKKFKSLKRHLMTEYGMTPNQYRAKWNLPESYPMVAPNYTRIRSRIAKETGFGEWRRAVKR
jgi:predicted transcriptional regulator